MAGQPSVAASWCHLRDNGTLRLAIQKRKKDRGLKLIELSALTGIASYRISRYLNKRKPNLNQHQLVSLANALDIRVTLNIQFE
jgi:transcriptional regulator with XRE-family HTH domain